MINSIGQSYVDNKHQLPKQYDFAKLIAAFESAINSRPNGSLPLSTAIHRLIVRETHSCDEIKSILKLTELHEGCVGTEWLEGAIKSRMGDKRDFKNLVIKAARDMIDDGKPQSFIKHLADRDTDSDISEDFNNKADLMRGKADPDKLMSKRNINSNNPTGTMPESNRNEQIRFKEDEVRQSLNDAFIATIDIHEELSRESKMVSGEKFKELLKANELLEKELQSTKMECEDFRSTLELLCNPRKLLNSKLDFKTHPHGKLLKTYLTHRSPLFKVLYRNQEVPLSKIVVPGIPDYVIGHLTLDDPALATTLMEAIEIKNIHELTKIMPGNTTPLTIEVHEMIFKRENDFFTEISELPTSEFHEMAEKARITEECAEVFREWCQGMYQNFPIKSIEKAHLSEDGKNFLCRLPAILYVGAYITQALNFNESNILDDELRDKGYDRLYNDKIIGSLRAAAEINPTIIKAMKLGAQADLYNRLLDKWDEDTGWKKVDPLNVQGMDAPRFLKKRFEEFFKEAQS